MARPSKAKSPRCAKFAVYEDVKQNDSIPTPDSSRSKTIDDRAVSNSDLDVSDYVEEDSHLEDISEDLTPSNFIEQTDTEIDDDNANDDEEDRRESTLTRRTSISSLPESSVFDTDYESRLPAMHKPYTPPSTRPTFRRPESVRRMQLTASPTPYERTSPRRSVLHAKSRTGTPRSVRQSPRPRPLRYQEEDDEVEEKKEYPLVLLHVTLLPVELRWSAESMLEVLPASVVENLQLLRSKVDTFVLDRGILIPHPKEEYELLEERLLEALELKKERVTKCGHFRARDSTSSTSSSSSVEGSIKSADSGVGSSLDGEDVERCTTCSSPVKGANLAVDARGKKWSIKVFAANGLMRASAWTAAWSEMERVDVEILPWISESLRKQLDAMAEREEEEEEEEEERRRRKDDEARLKELVEEQVRIAHEERKRIDELERECAVPAQICASAQPHAVRRPVTRTSDLPKVYRTADIPLSILLRNYIFLLAQDKRNVAIFALTILALWMSLRTAVMQPRLDLIPMPATCEQALREHSVSGVNNGSMSLDADNEVLSGMAKGATAIEEVLSSLHVSGIDSSPVVKTDGAITIGDPQRKEEDLASLSSSTTSTVPLARLHFSKAHEPALPSTSDENVQDVCVNDNLADKILALKLSS